MVVSTSPASSPPVGAVTTVDAHWRVVSLDAEALALGGADAATPVGRDVRELFPQVVGSSLEDAIRIAIEERRPASAEHYAVTIDRWLDVQAVPHPDGGAMLFQRDCTARVQATRWADAQRAVLGMIATGAPRQLTLDALARAVDALVPGAADHAAEPGDRRLVEEAAQLARLVLDIGVAEERLVDSQARLALALEAARMTTWEWEARGDTVTSTGAIGALEGIIGGIGVGSLAAFLSHVHPDDHASVRAALDAALVGGRDFEAEFRVVEEGALRWLSAKGRVFRDPRGRPVRMAGVAADVTERRELELQLRQAQKMEAVGQLAGGVAHDFNNLLTVIRTYGEFLRADLPAGSQQADDAGEVLKAVDRAAALTRQLLAFSRRQVLAPRPLDLGDVVRGIEPMLHRLLGDDVQLVTMLAASPLPLHADPGQLEQVIVNLALNARDAMPDGGVLVMETKDVVLDAAGAARLQVPAPVGRCVVLAVTDTGCGIEPSVQARIFEPFFTTKAAGKGTGLGLATVDGIVAQSGGGIALRSAPGRGTTMQIHLPWDARALEAVAAIAGAAAGQARGTESVLVVEDEAAVRTAVRRLLEWNGYSVLEARHGADALRLVSMRTAAGAAPPDLVLSDVNMPEMGGRALAERLSRDFPGLRVLLMSGYTGEALATRGGVPADADVIAKPFSGDELLARVRATLDARAR